jgi:MFS family permease
MAGIAASLRGPRTYAAPPDGGWGWVVTAGAFLTYCTTVGLQYCVGLVYRALLLDPAFTKGADRSALAWVVSIETSLFLGGQLLAGVIVNRAGVRAAVLTGAVLICTGFFASAAAPSPAVLYVTFGGLVGVGSALPSAAAVVLIQRYFKARRTTATGLAVCGSGAGALVLGPAVEALISSSSWRAACVFLGALNAAVLPAAALVFVPIVIVAGGGSEGGGGGDGGSGGVGGGGVDGAAATKLAVADGGGAGAGDDPAPAVVEWGGPAPAPAGTAGDDPSQPPPASPPPPGAVVAATAPASLAPPSSPIRRTVSTAPRLSVRQLLAVRPFALWITFVAVYGACWFVIFAHFVTFVQEAGTSPSTTSLLIVAQGVANTVGRAGLGILADRIAVPKLRILVACIATVGIATAALSVAGASLWYQVVYMVVNGLAGGSIVSLQAPITVDLVGLASLPLAQGVFHMAQAPLVLASPPIAAAMRAGLDDYRPVWMTTGVFMCVSAAICALVDPREGVEGGGSGGGGGGTPRQRGRGWAAGVMARARAAVAGRSFDALA